MEGLKGHNSFYLDSGCFSKEPGLPPLQPTGPVSHSQGLVKLARSVALESGSGICSGVQKKP